MDTTSLASAVKRLLALNVDAAAKTLGEQPAHRRAEVLDALDRLRRPHLSNAICVRLVGLDRNTPVVASRIAAMTVEEYRVHLGTFNEDRDDPMCDRLANLAVVALSNQHLDQLACTIEGRTDLARIWCGLAPALLNRQLEAQTVVDAMRVFLKEGLDPSSIADSAVALSDFRDGVTLHRLASCSVWVQSDALDVVLLRRCDDYLEDRKARRMPIAPDLVRCLHLVAARQALRRAPAAAMIFSAP